ncbi:MAG: metalloregulator ArsR/SmtB family transcription factor [Candidatus Obscuribacterales bacterium]|nr:metalloregulator ArsR/SmtB family transcription factor [Candidatus Obscuribacterales bacterium]
MEHSKAVEMLSALAHDTRLSIYKLLVRQGPEGLAAGDIAKKLEVAAPTLSFHLSHLSNAGLIKSERQSRSIIYAANYDTMNQLLSYLTEQCCQGD